MVVEIFLKNNYRFRIFLICKGKLHKLNKSPAWLGGIDISDQYPSWVDLDRKAKLWKKFKTELCLFLVKHSTNCICLHFWTREVMQRECTHVCRYWISRTHRHIILWIDCAVMKICHWWINTFPRMAFIYS